MTHKSAVTPCPCGHEAGYVDCCGRWHEGAQRLLAPTAEVLMRSRYSAHVLGLQNYLQDTWHPRTRPLGVAPPSAGLRWLGLEVRRHTPIDDEHAAVEFVARSKQGGRADRMHVTSRFERVEGRWLYVDDEDAAA